MKSILQEIADKENFDAFIQEQQKLATYKPLWKNEMETDYSASGNFNEYVGSYAEAMMGSIIDKNSDKPLRSMPDLGTISGSLGRIGDRWQLDNDRLDRLMQLEDRYRRRAGSFSNEQKGREWQKVLKFLFDMFDPARIAPHKRIDHLYYSGLSNSEYEVTLANNPNGVQWTIPLGLKMFKLRSSDSLFSDSANANPTGVIQHFVRVLRASGLIVTHIEANYNTVSKILAAKVLQDTFSVNVGTRGKVSPAGVVSLELYNQYLSVSGLPPIKIVDAYMALPNKQVVNAFKDDRLVFRTGAPVAKLMIKDALESRDPHPNKVYSVYEENLISSYRTEEGRFVEYEMNAIPVFNGKDQMAILKVDEKDS